MREVNPFSTYNPIDDMSCGGGGGGGGGWGGGTDNESSKLSHHQLLETPSHPQILVEIITPNITTHYLT